jgi:hypothetical protein
MLLRCHPLRPHLRPSAVKDGGFIGLRHGFSGTKSMRRSRQAAESEDLPGEGFLAPLG